MNVCVENMWKVVSGRNSVLVRRLLYNIEMWWKCGFG